MPDVEPALPISSGAHSATLSNSAFASRLLEVRTEGHMENDAMNRMRRHEPRRVDRIEYEACHAFRHAISCIGFCVGWFR
jgi:hypothetical protein